MADAVPFAVLNRLVADLTLARETHVLRYGLRCTGRWPNCSTEARS